VRSGLACSALIKIAVGDGRPGILIGGRFGFQRGNPGSRRHEVRFDAAIFTRATAGKIGHRLLTFGINEEIKAIYTQWIKTNYEKDNSLTSIDRKGERTVEEQWNNIEASLTNDLKDKVSGPIEWTRIHMLPDHVYFNHSQHVTVGKIACQQCHGKVEQMPDMYQYSPLSMGWCVNCHRETEVQFTGNDYYNTYKQYHDAISKGERSKVTVEDIGGLECQKCHY